MAHAIRLMLSLSWSNCYMFSCCLPNRRIASSNFFLYYRYRVVFSVSDKRDSVFYRLWRRDWETNSCSSLWGCADCGESGGSSISLPMGTWTYTNWSNDLNHSQGIGVNAQVDTELPRSLAPVVGNTYTFQLKLKDFNFTPNHQTFTISCIYLAPELAPTPTFVVSLFPLGEIAFSSFSYSG